MIFSKRFWIKRDSGFGQGWVLSYRVWGANPAPAPHTSTLLTSSWRLALAGHVCLGDLGRATCFLFKWATAESTSALRVLMSQLNLPDYFSWSCCLRSPNFMLSSSLRMSATQLTIFLSWHELTSTVMIAMLFCPCCACLPCLPCTPFLLCVPAVMFVSAWPTTKSFSLSSASSFFSILSFLSVFSFLCFFSVLSLFSFFTFFSFLSPFTPSPSFLSSPSCLSPLFSYSLRTCQVRVSRL